VENILRGEGIDPASVAGRGVGAAGPA